MASLAKLPHTICIVANIAEHSVADIEQSVIRLLHWCICRHRIAHLIMYDVDGIFEQCAERLARRIENEKDLLHVDNGSDENIMYNGDGNGSAMVRLERLSSRTVLRWCIRGKQCVDNVKPVAFELSLTSYRSCGRPWVAKHCRSIMGDSVPEPQLMIILDEHCTLLHGFSPVSLRYTEILYVVIWVRCVN